MNDNPHKWLITVSGLPATRKLALASSLAIRRGVPLESAKAIFRDMAREPIRACTSAALQGIARHDNGDLDREVDDKLRSFGTESMISAGCVIEGCWVKQLFPQSSSILLISTEEWRITVIQERDQCGRDEARKILFSCQTAVEERYFRLYGQSLNSFLTAKNTSFDIVMDMTNLSVREAHRETEAQLQILAASTKK